MTTERPIPFEGALTYQQFRAGQRLHGGSQLALLVIFCFLAVVFVVSAIFAVVEGEPLWRPLGLLAFAAVFLLLIGLQEWSFRRAWKTHKLAHDRMRGTLDETNLSIEAEHSSSHIPWDRLHQWQANSKVLLIYQSTNAVHILPRELFESDEDWIAARDLASRKLPSRRKARSKSRLWNLLIWLAIFLVVVLLSSIYTG